MLWTLSEESINAMNDDVLNLKLYLQISTFCLYIRFLRKFIFFFKQITHIFSFHAVDSYSFFSFSLTTMSRKFFSFFFLCLTLTQIYLILLKLNPQIMHRRWVFSSLSVASLQRLNKSGGKTYRCVTPFYAFYEAILHYYHKIQLFTVNGMYFTL